MRDGDHGPLTIGQVAVLFAAYQVVVTDPVADRRQDALSEDLRDEWTAGPAWAPPTRGRPAAAGEVPTGSSFAGLRIPLLGRDHRRVVLEGTTEEQLTQGLPGRCAGTAMPGPPGNVAITGQRVGKGSPFLHPTDYVPATPSCRRPRTSG